MISTTNKAAAYLGARLWLEWYAGNHAELSPMDGITCLPAGREAFYYACYRKDILERQGIRKAEAADARAYALAARRAKLRCVACAFAR